MARPVKRAGRLATISAAWGMAVRGLWDAVSSTVALGLSGTYAVLDPRRKILPQGWQTLLTRDYSANELSQLSLVQLRSLCRKLERDNCTARAISEGIVAQTVGSGIGLEPDTGDITTDRRIRAVWVDYIKGCDITGKRSIFSLQSQAMREWTVAGEHVWRLCVFPERADRGLVPVLILPLDSEWLSGAFPEPSEGSITRVPGIDLDAYGRPVNYHLCNPEMLSTRSPETVPAAQVIHGFEPRRPLQNRGEPILTPTIERLFQEGDLVDAELKAAVNCAAMAMVVTSEAHSDPDTTIQGTATDPAQAIGIGAVARMFPGETVQAFSHNRPSQQIAPFRTTLRGDQSGACRVSQRWLDRDYSKANYSSMRADNLDSDRLLSPLTETFGHATIGDLYMRVLPYLCAIAGVPVPKRQSYRLIPDGQAYVDPMKDCMAAAMAINFGLTTYEAEIGKRGGDYREVWAKLALEEKERKSLGLNFSVPSTIAPANTESEPATSEKGAHAA
jgi:lambda family phage portal protein